METKRQFTAMFLIIGILAGLCFGGLAASYRAVAVSAQTITCDGNEISAEIYNIDGFNYFKLRDIAALLNGTPSRFSVSYDPESRVVTVTSGQVYEEVGGELEKAPDRSESCVLTNQNIIVNGAPVTAIVYNIGGNNFFKLRDLAELLGFGVDYEENSRTAVIDSTPVNVTPSDRDAIEGTLDLSKNSAQEWTYAQDTDSWTLSIVSAAAYPKNPTQQGVSVNVPGQYIKGIDTDGDGAADVEASSAGDGAVCGSLVIDYERSVTNSAGETFTADTAPVLFIVETERDGSATNTRAGGEYAAKGYISVTCGSRSPVSAAASTYGSEKGTGSDSTVNTASAYPEEDSLTEIQADSIETVVTAENGTAARKTENNESAAIAENTAPAQKSENSESVATTENGTTSKKYEDNGIVVTAENSETTDTVYIYLADQKNAIRFVRYNILLGNLPGSLEYWVSVGVTENDDRASLLVTTGDSPDYYDAEIEAGAAGVYALPNGDYSTVVTVDGADYELSDGVWGAVVGKTAALLSENGLSGALDVLPYFTRAGVPGGETSDSDAVHNCADGFYFGFGSDRLFSQQRNSLFPKENDSANDIN